MKTLNRERAWNFCRNSWFKFNQTNLAEVLKIACKKHLVNYLDFYE